MSNSWRGFDLALPLKIKYDRDGMFLATGVSNWYSHYKFSGSNYVGDPVSYKVNSYNLMFNFTMGFEKAIEHDCEIFVDVFYERLMLASADSKHLFYRSNPEYNIGFSFGILIRGK